MKPTPADLLTRFSYHSPASAPNPAAVTNAHSVVRGVLHSAAEQIAAFCPAGRELALALTKIEEAMFWANAAIARNHEAMS